MEMIRKKLWTTQTCLLFIRFDWRLLNFFRIKFCRICRCLLWKSLKLLFEFRTCKYGVLTCTCTYTIDYILLMKILYICRSSYIALIFVSKKVDEFEGVLKIWKKIYVSREWLKVEKVVCVKCLLLTRNCNSRK